ncbi:MAG: PIN domain-containing protein [Deltaproteobacteria bacterium]|nr:MAG: PIN domain-containing protein [Deltaproteobacteria bacterium]
MKVIVDTSIWSLALGRGKQSAFPSVQELRNLIQDHRVQMIGPIRQEILSGIRSESQFKKLQKHLESFPDLPILTEDYVTAATFFNLCRSKGVQGSNTDFLICSVAIRNRFSIYSTDKDFELFSRHLPILLHRPKEFRQLHED